MNFAQLMADYNVSSIPVESHHQIHMVGLMDILVHTVETFDALGPAPKANEFKAKFDISTDQLIGVPPLKLFLLHLIHLNRRSSDGIESPCTFGI